MSTNARSWINTFCQKNAIKPEYQGFQKGDKFTCVLKIGEKGWLGDSKPTKKEAEESVAQIAKNELHKENKWENEILPWLMEFGGCTNKELITAIMDKKGYMNLSFSDFIEIGEKTRDLYCILDKNRVILSATKFRNYFEDDYDLYNAFIGAICKFTSVSNAFDVNKKMLTYI